MKPLFLLSALVLLAMPAAAQAAQQTLAGPVSARVVDVLDGDTIAFEADVWLGTSIAMHVRIRGIDTPELHTTCAAEKTMAEQARQQLVRLAGSSIRLTDVAYDKYGGRVDANVANAAGLDLGAAMLKAGLAHPYDGNGPRADWCPVASVRK
jgi:endonuclease YncB( thermonuclease family)